MTPARLADLHRGVAALLRPGATPSPPRACLGLAVGDEVVTASAQASTAEAPLTSGTVVDLGSVTKLVATTSALMALVDAGTLTVDVRVGDLLAQAAGQPVADATLADLLEHRAGLVEWWPLYLAADAPRSPEAALACALALPLRHPPRTARHYSDLGFMLLGACVSAAHGTALDAAVEQLALRPAGLDATTWRAPAPGHPVAASSHGDRVEREMVATGRPYPVSEAVTAAAATFPWREHVLLGEVNDGNAFHAWGGVAGHAGLFSTVDDLLVAGRGWLASLRGQGPVGAATLRRFLQPGADDGQALGFRRWVDVTDGCAAEAFGHTGFPGVALAVLPGHGAAVALATDRLLVDGAPRPTEELWRTALAAAHHCLHT